MTKGLEIGIMSSHAEASGVNISSRVEGHGTEDASEETSNGGTCTPCFKPVRPRLRSADTAGEGRSSSVEHLVRPALPGRKAHRKTCKEDNRGRWKEGNEEADEEGQNVERVGGKNAGKQKQRKTGRTESLGDGALESQGRGSTESLSSSSSDIQLNSALEVGEGSNNLKRGHSCPKPHCTGCSHTNNTSLTAQSPRPPTQSRSTSLSPQRLSSRTASGDLHRYAFSSSRDLDPFWAEVRTGAATGCSPQSHHTQTHIPSLPSSDLGEEEEDVEDGEEEGSGVMEVMSQTMTPALVPACAPLGERRMSKREKNRMKCLRRRQRRRERWRQSQLQESRQVNDTLNSTE